MASHSHSLDKNVQLPKNTLLERTQLAQAVRLVHVQFRPLLFGIKPALLRKTVLGNMSRVSCFMFHVAHETGPYNPGFDTHVTLSKSRCIRILNSCLCAPLHLRSFFVLVLSIHFFLSRWEGKSKGEKGAPEFELQETLVGLSD
jgi:hypothetical protein